MIDNKRKLHVDYEKHLYRFLDSIELLKSSKSTYKRQINLFICWLQKKNIVEPNSETIIFYLNHLKNTRRLSDFTICGYLTAVKLFFSWLEATKKYSNIAKKIKGPKKKNTIKKDFLNRGQVEQLLKNIDRTTLDGKRDYALINLMVNTGVRVIDIQLAKRGDLIDCCDFVVLWVQSKGRDFKNKRISLDKKVFASIYEYFSARNSTSDADPIFASHSKKNFGQSMTTRSISRIVKNKLKDIGLDNKKISADSLRLTATNLLELDS